MQIGAQYATTGDFINRGVDLKGGSIITIEKQTVSVPELQQFLQDTFPLADISVRTLSSAGRTTGIIIDSDAQENDEIAALTRTIESKLGITQADYSIEIGASELGERFFEQMITALLVAFVLMGLVVMIYFRKLVPSLTVMASAFSDLVITLAIFNLTGLKLGSAGIAGFLMIIGYSVDTDILLNTRMLKRREGTPAERVYTAMRTGFTMIGTTLIALLIGIVFVQSEVVLQIMTILFIGLLVDTMMTYIFNVGILRIYLEKRQ